MHFLIKPASGACNMRCKYCFYTDEMENREVANLGMMPEETLEILVKKALSLKNPNDNTVTFAFQGGEPTLRGLPFFQNLIEYVRKYNLLHKQVQYAIQTNGYAINDAWAEFFAKNRFLVGVSIDGTPKNHDLYRVDAAGRGTYGRALAATRLFEKYHVDYNILTVVTRDTAENIERIYHSYKKQGFTFQQYINCLEPLGEEPGGQTWSLDAETYGKFLRTLFDLWYADLQSGHYVYNRTFENWVGILVGQMPEECGLCGICAPQYVVESDGGVYPCDFYVLDEYRIGNILTDSFESLEQNRKALGFIEASMAHDPSCEACEWAFLCRGGCRRNRQSTDFAPGSPLTKNRFCASYKEFFSYAYPRLAKLAEEILRKNPRAGTEKPF